ncbi:MAG: PEP-CTERM system TPR-repeat protein PrsT [Gammaproteobacteria bacterium]|nr:PEP-CTERM system TPR-repeat protein PrsT [Gammaproteobacteria bacterium]
MDNRKRRRGAGGVWFLCVLVMSMGACGRPDPETELNAAAASFSAGNYEDAALRLNYVMQLEPDNIRARELSGDIALLLGDYANAATEFVHAGEHGAPRDSIALRLAEAHLGQGQIDEALKILDAAEAGLADDPLYWMLRADVLLAADRLLEAERSLEEAQQVGDGGARALTARAQIAFARGNPAEAFELLEHALVVAPNDPRVRIAHAELLARSDRLTEAAAELQRAADLYGESSIGPRETLSLLGLVQVHLARNDLDAAQAVAARLAQQAPQVQLTSYYQGLVKFRGGHFDDAAALIQPLVNASPETIQYRSLLGAIQLARGNVGQAEQQFLRVLAVSPSDPAASKLLAETRLRQQRPGAALDALQAVQDTAAEDPQIGLLSGIATMLSGNAEQGLLYLEQAAALDPTNELLKLQLARAYLATGRDADASSLLAASFGDDAHAIEANLLRFFAESRRGDAGSAADIAEELVAAYPDDPRVLTAIAVHFQLNGETGRARQLFERAAEFNTDDATARLFVAASLVQEGRQDEAELLLRQTILQQPENAQALAALAQLLARRGVFDEAAELFSRAAEHSTSVIPRLALVQMRLREGDVTEAKRQLDTAAVTAPDKPEVIALSGIVALAERRTDDAVALLERAAQLLPDHLGVTLALARARLANGQAAAARDALLRVLELAPGSFPIRLVLGDAELRSGNAERALSVAADLKVAFPSQAGGYLLEGRAFIAARQYTSASKSLASAFERQPTWPILALQIQALRLAGRSAEAQDANEAWLAENPGHGPAGLMRAVLLQAAGRVPEALEAYKSVLTAEPNNLVALNNAAWVSHELGEPGALSFAERAYNVGPENAAVLDTFGWILLARGQDELAIEKLSRAAELAPQAPEIRYHLAEALVVGGQSARAREILAALLTEERDFDERANAVRLLESMQAEVALDP